MLSKDVFRRYFCLKYSPNAGIAMFTVFDQSDQCTGRCLRFEIESKVYFNLYV